MKSEVIIPVVLVLLLAGFLNPFQILMPTTIQMVVLTMFAIVFILFSGLIWKEKIRDEREGINRMFAARYAFLTGTIILATGLLVQGFQHNVDPWLVFTLIAMILAKAFGRRHADNTS